MKIGIIGAGHMGSVLGKAWAARGHQIMYGLRNVEKYGEVLQETGAQHGTLEQATAFGEAVLLAVGWPDLREVVPGLGYVQGKILIDISNRSQTTPGDAGSAMEDVARMAPGAAVVKAFNTISAESLANPDFGKARATTFVCGDDENAKRVVVSLAWDAGLDAVDAGPASSAPMVEGLTKLWFVLAARYGRESSFTLLRR
jgi:predicted dinucleotide-binding enzyme